MIITRCRKALVAWPSSAIFALLISAAPIHADETDSRPQSTHAAAARWDSIEITGNESFSDAEIKDELFAQPDFLIANHHFADQEEFPHVVEKLLIKGYRYKGFPDVAIEREKTSSLERSSPASWTIHVDEGQRIMCGGVRVPNAQQIGVERLTERLTSPYPPRDATPTFAYADGNVVTQWVDEDGDEVKLTKPIWDPESGVPFGGDWTVQSRVSDALSDLGFSNSEIVVRFEIDKTNQTGTLIVDIKTEGGHDRADSIELSGLNLNSRDSLLEYLKIAEGDVIDREVKREIAQRLWESGRFEKQSVSFDAEIQALKIHVVEQQGLPSIAEPLNDNAKILLKMCRWLGGVSARGDDCEHNWHVNGAHVRVILGADGLFAGVDKPTSANVHHGGLMHLLVDRDQVILNHVEMGQKLRMPLLKLGEILLTERYYADPTPDEFLKGATSLHAIVKRRKGRNAIQFNLVSSPIDWLPLAYKDSVQFERDGATLIVTHGHERMRINADTGQVDEWVTEKGTIHFGPGLLIVARNALEKQIADKPAVDINDQPISAMAKYILAEPVIHSMQQTFGLPDVELPLKIDLHLASAIRKLADGGMFSILDEVRDWIVQDKGAASFQIPIGLNDMNLDMATKTGMFARIALHHVHEFFEEETWPSTLTREVALVQLDGTEFSREVVVHLVNDTHTGPIGLSAIVLVCKFWDQPQKTIRVVSQRALSRLNPEAFAADFELLTRIIPVDYIKRLRKSFQSLTPQELDAVVNTIDNEAWKLALRRIHSVGQLDREELSEAGFWYLVLHGPMESWLQK